MNTKNNNKRETMVVNGEEFSRADFERDFANKRNRMSLWVRVGVAFLLGFVFFYCCASTNCLLRYSLCLK